ncbi:MAG: 50S ribosomal protein L10 [Saprospiraceae bacterium]|nr:50S ribosomal protein L10 [Saprospiraceae bacterium]
MTRENKTVVIDELTEKFKESSFFYITDSSDLNVEQINKFRGLCYEKDVEMRVVKNTLIKKALEAAGGEEAGYEDLYAALKGPSSLMFTSIANSPAKLIKEFRKSFDKPVLKAAYIDSSVYVGDEALDQLASLKSKEELIGDIVMLLQSPAKNVISALKSSGSTIAGLVKTLQEREQ